MLTLSTTAVEKEILGLLLPLFRISAFYLAVPIIGSNLVPRRVRMGLALATTLLVLPALPAMPAVQPFSPAGWWLTIEQVVIGAALGFAVQLLFHAVAMAGQLISMNMGLGFASMMDPSNGISVPILGQFYLFMVTLLFLASNGHLVVIEATIESFRILPVGAGLPIDGLALLARAGSWIFGAALLISLPAMTTLLVVNLAFGIISRAAPQLNLFSLGFPFTLVFGLLLVWLTLSALSPQFTLLSGEAFELMRALMQNGAAHG